MKQNGRVEAGVGSWLSGKRYLMIRGKVRMKERKKERCVVNWGNGINCRCQVCKHMIFKCCGLFVAFWRWNVIWLGN